MIPVSMVAAVVFTSASIADTAANGAILVYDASFSTLLDSHVVGFKIQGVAVDSNGYVWAADPDAEKLWCFDPSDWSTVYEITMPTGFAVNGVAYRGTNDRIYATEVSNDTWRLYNASTGAFDTTLSVSTGATGDGICWWEDYDCFVSTVDPNILYLIDTDGEQVGAEFIDASGGSIDWIEHGAIANGKFYFNNDAEYHGSVTDGNRVWSFPLAKIAWLLQGRRDFSYRIWVDLDATTSADALFVQGNPVSGRGWGLYATTTTNIRPFIRQNSGAQVFADRAIASGPHLIHVTVDRTNDVMAVYVDGIKSGADISISTITANIYNGNTIGVGASPSGDSTRHANGRFDQSMCRIGVMSAGEIATEYEWITNNAAFWTAGTWQSPSSTEADVSPVVATWSIPSVTATAAFTASVSPAAATWAVPSATATAAYTASASPVAASWSVPEVTGSPAFTADVSPVSASWSLPAVTAASGESASVSPVAATWSVGAVTATAGFTASVSPVVATWSLPAVSALPGFSADVSPVSAAWSIVSPVPTFAASAIVSPVVATWTVVNVTASIPSTVSPPVSLRNVTLTTPRLADVTLSTPTLANVTLET